MEVIFVGCQFFVPVLLQAISLPFNKCKVCIKFEPETALSNEVDDIILTLVSVIQVYVNLHKLLSKVNLDVSHNSSHILVPPVDESFTTTTAFCDAVTFCCVEMCIFQKTIDAGIQLLELKFINLSV